MTRLDTMVTAWVALTSFWALLLFGWDKLCAVRGRRRVSEFHLALAGAVGGWPGGLIGMLLFRHKTAKGSFWLKYAVALLLWCAGVYCYWQAR